MNIAFANLRGSEDKDAALHSVIAALAEGRSNASLSVIEEELIEAIPGNPFAYYAPKSMLTLSARGKTLAASGVIARQGIGASTRFHRLVWEVPPNEIRKSWLHMAHGTPPALFYKPTTHLFLWTDDGREAKADVLHRYPYLKGNYGFKIQAEEWYRQPGLCYGKRTEAFTVQVLPADHVFSFEGTAVFPGESHVEPWGLLGLLNSAPVSFWLNVVCAEHKAYNYVEGVPLPPWEPVQGELGSLAKEGWELQRKLDIHNITSPVFIVPALLSDGPKEIPAATQTAQAKADDVVGRLRAIKQQIDNICGVLFDVEGQLADEDADRPGDDHDVSADEGDEEMLQGCDTLSTSLVEDLFEYVVGVAFGRWDARIVSGDVNAQELPSAFDPLPKTAPGSLDIETITDEYPFSIPSHGVLVNSRGHFYDAASQIEKAMQIIWRDKASEVEQQLSAELAVATLGDYFTNYSKYFGFHLKRHSKGHRYAPLYWPLSTPSGSYALWLYYHRLTDQTLYTCVNDFIEPKLKQVAEEANRLRSKTNRSSSEEKELERLSDLELELKDFRDELLRIAKFWKPDLNDGVQTTAAPLWKLFQHRQWQNRLKETWEKLEAGEYDWAHLALSIWPDRVVRASHKDRSYAIAHDLENRLWHEVAVKKVGRGGKMTTTTEWKPRELSESELRQIVAEVKAR